MASTSEIKAMLASRELARRSLKAHLSYKFRYYYNRPLLDNWHIGYICELLEAVLSGEVLRLMLNMPPSYGKTEIIARTLIPYAVGKNNQHKFIYTSYGDTLSSQTSLEARNYFKSQEFINVFGHDNLSVDQSSHWRLPQGGGLYATTIGGAITGFHAHTILVDDPLKASEAMSKAALKTVSNYFTNSLLSRLDETANKKASIVIIMQRLHKNDLCGELLEKHSSEWLHVNLKALENKAKIYTFGKFSYERAANEPLFASKHSLEDLEKLKVNMGMEFASQYQQDPSDNIGGVFNMSLLSTINDYELPELSEYIFVDAAESIEATADDRAIVCEGWAIDSEERELCIMLDCFHGKWDEDETTDNIINMALSHPDAQVYVEQAGGGITLLRLLNKKIAKVNAKRRINGLDIIKNPTYGFSPRKDISKNASILAMLSYFNAGQLKIRNNAAGADQIKLEFEKFNPAKTSNVDNCIDALCKGFVLNAVVTPKKLDDTKTKVQMSKFASKKTWRV